MRSSSGEHYIALDHIRAFAVFLVFTWHFIHGFDGYPVTFDYVPSLFPLSLIDEGHTGVAIFMTLSGYLFAKLLDGRSIRYKSFFGNRILRLMPLLIVMILIVGVRKYFLGENLFIYTMSVAAGLIFPTLPNGGWSITVEFHCYLILPIILRLLHKAKILLPSIIIAAIIYRIFLHHTRGEIQSLAYSTIIGRLDQFLLGMLAFRYRTFAANRHRFAIAGISAFLLFYWYFNQCGGFYKNPHYPSPSLIWIVLPTIEGMGYALAIAYYDNSFRPSDKGISGFIGSIGTYSYSIYLFHLFFVFRMASFVHKHVMDISNFYLACLWSAICFSLMIPVGYLSFRFIEAPFLKLRRQYVDFKDKYLFIIFFVCCRGNPL